MAFILLHTEILPLQNIPYLLQAINLLTYSRFAARHKNHFFNIMAINKFEILLFKQNYQVSNIINTSNLQNINIVAAFSYNI